MKEISILDMTVGECLENRIVKDLLEKYFPTYTKLPLALFKRKKVSELLPMAISQKLTTSEEAEKVIKMINEKLNGK